MRKLQSAAALFSVLGILSCSSADDPTTDPAPGGGEPATGESQEFLTGTCFQNTIGHPCDPDGAAGALLECGGICLLNTTGVPACVPITTAGIATMNGRVCGSSFGTSCANTCLNGACVAVQAKTGTACRPGNTFNADSCDGACTAQGFCAPLLNPCAYGRNGCVFNACDMTAASTCAAINLLKDTTCTDNNQCTLSDKCDGAGTCAAGAAKNCDDGNVCTTDTCNPNNGVCLGQPNTSACDDKNACTTGDTCASGVCQAGTTPTNCDDNNACTTDGCNPATGCTHAAKDCNDNNACTTDSCNTSSGACSNTAITCNDNNPCTTDTCAAATGCVYTPISGCPDAGAGGTGGSGTGGSGTGGSGTGGTGTGGTGTGGTGTGGTGTGGSGTGGSGTGGTGTGGTGTGGSATGGAAGSGGSATGGAAGSATGGAAGSGTGGAAGSSSGGSAGSSTGGSSTGGSSTGGSSTGGSSTGGKDGGVSGKDGGTGFDTSEDDGGCGCRVPAKQAPSSSWLVLAGLGALFARRRRS